MRYILLVLWGLAATPAVWAQGGAAETQPVTEAALAAPTASPDTAAALHRLFAKHRARRMRFALGTLVVGTALTIMPAVSAKRANDPLDAGFSAFGSVVAGTLTATLVPLELLHHNQYTRRRERQAVAQWQAHQLPAELRQRLKPNYFIAPR